MDGVLTMQNLFNFMPGEWEATGQSPTGWQGRMGGLLSGDDPLLNIGLGILANNNSRNLGQVLGRGVAQGVGQTQQAKQFKTQQELIRSRLDAEKRQQEAERRRQEAIPRLLSGETSYITEKETPIESFQNVPSAPLDGAQAPNFGTQRQSVTTMQKSPVFDEKSYMDDLVAAGFGDDIIRQKLMPKQQKIAFTPNGVAYDENNPNLKVGESYAKVDPESINPNKPFLIIDGQIVPNKAYQDYEINKAKAGAANNNVSVNTGQKGFDNTLKLRGDFRSEPIYKAHQDVKSAYSQISVSLKKNSPAGDLAGATKLMKILDPGSVVRESELGMAMAAGGKLDRLYNYADMVTRGTKLTPEQRKDFQALADGLYAESANQYNSKRSEYESIANRNELNAVDVVGEPEKPISAPSTFVPPPKEAINMLKMNPKLRAQFDAKYGPGASAQVLGK
jgi:hypothetical protein